MKKYLEKIEIGDTVRLSSLGCDSYPNLKYYYGNVTDVSDFLIKISRWDYRYNPETFRYQRNFMKKHETDAEKWWQRELWEKI